MPCSEYPHYVRVMAVLKFIRYALDNSHQKVGKTARRVFYYLARMQAQNATILKQVRVIIPVEINKWVVLIASQICD